MYEIEIANQQAALPIDRGLLTRVAQGTLAAEQVDRAELSIALVDDAAIRDVNRRFLGHDYATDVISFLLECDPADDRAEAGRTSAGEPAPAGPRGAGKGISGEIILSTETAATQAGEYGWSPHDELLLYLVHGILHLCGYDDLSEDELRIMRAREAEVLSLWNLSPRYAPEA